MSKQYLPLVVPVMVTAYLALVHFVLKRAASRGVDNDNGKGTATAAVMNYIWMRGKCLSSAAKSSLWGAYGTFFLFWFRFAGLLFFSLPLGGDGWYVMTHGSSQFTDWNVAFIVWFYMLACLSSILMYLSTSKNSRVTSAIERYGDAVGKVTSTMFVVMLSNALFITVVNFTLLDQGMEWKNLVVHLFTTLFALVELRFNSVHIERSDIVFAVGWVYVYLMAVWISLCAGMLSNWPYEFLDCQSPYSVLIYMGLLAVNALFFVAVCTISGYLKGTKEESDLLRVTLIENGTTTDDDDDVDEEEEEKNMRSGGNDNNAGSLPNSMDNSGVESVF